MNSLKIKLLGLTVAFMAVSLAITGWHNLRTQKALLSSVADENSRLMGETIRNTITTDMTMGANGRVASILEKIAREPAIRSLRIFDESGRILRSSLLEETGDLIPAADLLAYRSGPLSFADPAKGQDIFTRFMPIYNGPSCHRCHEAAQVVLGILHFDLAFGELEGLRAQGREAVFFSSFAMLIVLVFATGAFILHYVDTPIRRLVAAMTEVEEGNFDTPPTRIGNSAELSLLADKFNSMVERLKKLIKKTVSHELEMAVTEEKLQHHDQIREMNQILEERLKEIEYLNISLEERIEEIEDANYKIADLASDLEGKNSTLEQAVSRLSALNKIGLAVNSTMDPSKLFGLLIRKTTEAAKARIGYILLIDKESGQLRIGEVAGIANPLDSEMRIPLAPGGVSHWVSENRKPLLIRSVEEDKGFNMKSALGFCRESVICAPLIIKDEVIGTLTISNKVDGSCFSPEDLELLSTIAAQASIAIQNARLYEEQQLTYLSTVQALISAVEASDAYTRGHSERVKWYSMALADHLGLAPESRQRLEEAAILHDIGKIGIDASVLHKKGKLSDNDFDMLKHHPQIGVRILEPIHFLQGVIKIILHHHERYDGCGYPQGLGGEDIPVEARILAVTDTYDAMTSDRPYRKALSHEVAINEISTNAGSQFDPEIARAFVELCGNGGLQGQQEEGVIAI